MLILLFIISVFSITRDRSLEQIAFNYFAREILTENYPKAKKIYFSGQSEIEESIAGPFSQCFESDNGFSEFYYQHKKAVSEKIAIEFSDFSKVKKSAKSKAKSLNLKVYIAAIKNDGAYVYIKAFKEKHFVDHYLLKISSNSQKVVDICHVNEII